MFSYSHPIFDYSTTLIIHFSILLLISAYLDGLLDAILIRSAFEMVLESENESQSETRDFFSFS